jgi:hypothetical protein
MSYLEMLAEAEKISRRYEFGLDRNGDLTRLSGSPMGSALRSWWSARRRAWSPSPTSASSRRSMVRTSIAPVHGVVSS